MKLTYYLSILFTLSQIISFAGEKINPNQFEEMSLMKSGNYTLYVEINGEWSLSSLRPSTDVKIEKNNAGEVIKVERKDRKKGGGHFLLQTYAIAKSKKFGPQKISVPCKTHFERSHPAEMCLIVLDGNIYHFRRKTNRESFKLLECIGEKPMSFSKVNKLIQEYQEVIDKQKEKVSVTLSKLQSKYSDFWQANEGYFKVGNNDKYGFVDENLKVVIPLEYEASFNKIVNGVVGVKKNGKQGYVNVKNQIVIPLEYDYVKEVFENRIRVIKDKKYAFFDLKGNLISNWYDEAHDFESGVASIRINKKIGFLKTDGTENWIFDDVPYRAIFNFGDYYKVYQGDFTGLIDKTGKVILPTVYHQIYAPSEGIVSVVNGDEKRRHGYFKLGYGWITEMIYDKAYQFENGVGTVVLNGSEYPCDKNGEVKYKKTTIPPNDSPETPYHRIRDTYVIMEIITSQNKYEIFVQKDYKRGIVMLDGTVRVPCKYSWVEKIISGTYGVCNAEGLYAVFDDYSLHKQVTDFKYKHFETTSDAYLEAYTDNEIDIMTFKGRFIMSKPIPENKKRAVESSPFKKEFSQSSSSSSSSIESSAKVQVIYRNIGSNSMYVYYTKPDGSQGKGRITKGSSSWFTVKTGSKLYYTLDDNGSGRNKQFLVTSKSTGNAYVEK